MSNMSYCRFRNTYADLLDCYENWDDLDNRDDVTPLELKARKLILKLCKQIVDDYYEEATNE